MLVGGLGALAGTAALLLVWFGSYLQMPSSAGRTKGQASGPERSAIFGVTLATASIGLFLWMSLQQVQSGLASKVGLEQQSETVRSDDDSDVARIKDYLENAGRVQRAPIQSFAPLSANSDLPDVATMIERLKDRLENSPGDVDGWRMLGWSYRHTNRLQLAIDAYQRALEIAPQRQDILDALADARSAATVPGPINDAAAPGK